jgi:squalene-hopene/tetraprenyl-beta-curcumene cyclase
MLQTIEDTTQITAVAGCHEDDLLLSDVKQSLLLSTQHSREQMKPDGHWCGEVKTNATTTAEYVYPYQALGLDLMADREAIISWLLSEQRADGSWSIAPLCPGDISVTVEAYLALKILGVPEVNHALLKAATLSSLLVVSPRSAPSPAYTSLCSASFLGQSYRSCQPS